MASIKQSMSRPINADVKGVKAVVNEAADGIQAVPTELVIKAADDSTFTQISDATPMPVKVVSGGTGGGGSVTVAAPLPAGTNKIGTVDAQLTGSYVVNNKLQVDVGGATFTGTIGDMQAKTLAVTLQNAVTAAGVGTSFTVAAYKTLTISVTGTSTSRTIAFEVADADGNWTLIQGVRLRDYVMDTQTTGTNEKWTFEVTGVTTFRANITAVAGGNVSVKGTAVA